eukprot:1535732-Amphidinium_carterae.2
MNGLLLPGAKAGRTRRCYSDRCRSSAAVCHAPTGHLCLAEPRLMHLKVARETSPKVMRQHALSEMLLRLQLSVMPSTVHEKQEVLARRREAPRPPATEAQKLHRLLIAKENSVYDVLKIACNTQLPLQPSNLPAREARQNV